MKKLIAVFAVCLGCLAVVGCENDDPCKKADNRCEECYTDPSSCQAAISACRVLIGRLRDDCCEAELDSINASCD